MEFRGFIESPWTSGDNTGTDDTAVEQDEEQNQANFDAEEMEAMINKNVHVAERSLKKQTVRLRSLENERRQVYGEFMYTEPWWELRVKIKNGDKIEEPPKYRLRSDDQLDIHEDRDQEGCGSVIYLFLTTCGVDNQAKDAFIKYLRDQAREQGENVDFSLLREVIEKAENIEDLATVCNRVKKRLEKSVHYSVVKIALDFPQLFETLPALLHKCLPKLLTSADQDQLIKLDRITRESPYLFGFSYETNLRLPEVHYDTFEKAVFFPDMEKITRGALLVYCALKEKSKRYGNTYCWLSSGRYNLKHYKPKRRKKKVRDLLGSFSSQQWDKMLDFLEDDMKAIKVETAVHEDGYGGKKEDKRLFLSRYYWAEVNIARYIKDLSMKEQDFVKCGNCQMGAESVFDIDEKESEVQQDVTDNEVSAQIPDTPTPDEATSDSTLLGQHSQLHSVSKSENDTAPVSTSSEWQSHDQQELCSRPTTRDDGRFVEDKDQQAAAKSIRENPFSLIIGRGGCGKTRVVCEVMKEYCGASIVMAAPTGKAASNLRKKFDKDEVLKTRNVKARTLHQIMVSFGKAEEPEKWDFKDTEILVVDECSMVSVVLLSKVLDLLMKHSKLKKLVLLGDYRQLPSIDCGNLLGDLYEYFKGDDRCVELRTNHRAGSEHIINCAIKISNQEMPDLNASEGFCLIDLEPRAPVERQKAILEDLSKGDAESHETSQFVAYTRNNCMALNDWCCPLYTGHEHKTKDGKSFQFLAGDKICPTRNAYITDIEKKAASTPKRKDDGKEDGKDADKLPDAYQRRLCNGEIYFIRGVPVCDKYDERGRLETEVELDDLDEQFTVPMSELKNLSHIRHAWARTIHTYQGSESDVVIYWLGEALNQTWQHVYTAVTRGRNKVIIVGQKDILRQAIKEPAEVRQTVLQERFKQNVRVRPGRAQVPQGSTPSRPGPDSHAETWQGSKADFGKTKMESLQQPSTSGYTNLKPKPSLQMTSVKTRTPGAEMGKLVTNPIHPSTPQRQFAKTWTPEAVKNKPLMMGIHKEQCTTIKTTDEYLAASKIDYDAPSTSSTIRHKANHATSDGDEHESFSRQMSADWSEEKLKLVVQMEEEALQHQEEGVLSGRKRSHDDAGTPREMDCDTMDEPAASENSIGNDRANTAKVNKKFKLPF